MKSIPGLRLGAAGSERLRYEKLLVCLLKKRGDRGLRIPLKNYPQRIPRIPWHDDSVTWDVDIPRDLERLSEFYYSGGAL